MAQENYANRGDAVCLRAGQLGLPIRDVKDIQIMEDVCVACGKNYVPEGRMVCPGCEGGVK